MTAIGDIQAAEAHRAQAGIEVVRVRDLVTAEVIRAHEDLRIAADQIDIAQRGVTAAEATRTLSQSRYSDGVGLALDVLEADRALTAASTALVAAIQVYNVAQVALLWATGELSPGVLAADG